MSSSRISITGAHDHFVNAYFIAYNSSYPILHERTFREQYLRKAQMPSNDIWHVIYYMVLAIGEWVSGHATEHQSLYYEAVRARLNFDILETGNMGVVQALLLLGNYLQKRDRPNTAYNFIGIAYRVALGLGLHRELPPGHGVSPFVLQRRRSLFWTLYCFDSGFSMTTGRPTLVSDTFIDIRKPNNIDDSSLTASDDKLQEVDYPTTYSAIIVQARLAVIANKVYSNFLSVRACSDVDDLVATMEQIIRNWRSSLPAFFFQENVPQWFLGPRQVLLWKEANLQIALLLASQRNHIEELDKMSISAKCQTVAVNTIHEISRFCLEHEELVHIGLSWYAVYFLLHAILALGLHQHVNAKQKNTRATTSTRQDRLPKATADAIMKARECLKLLSRTNKAASRTLEIVDRIEEALARPVTQENGTGNHETEETVTADAMGNRHTTDSQSDQLPAPILESVGPTNIANLFENPQENNLSQSLLFPSVSPENPYVDCVMNDWVAAVDPSLHFFFDNGTAELDNVFQGMEGFPNVLDADSFGYMTSTMHTVRMPEHEEHDSGR